MTHPNFYNDHNNKQFSTFDKDNDEYGYKHCAQLYGPWWMDKCHNSLLTGDYSFDGTCRKYATCIHWSSLNGYFNSLKVAIMMTRRKV